MNDKDRSEAKWKTDGDGVVYTQNGHVVCQFFARDVKDFVYFYDWRKNLKIVASAPDLLSSLADIVDLFYDDEATAVAMAGNMTAARRMVDELRSAGEVG